MFNTSSAAEADKTSDCDKSPVIVDGQERIRGENGTYMLASTGDAILDLFSSSTRIDSSKLNRTEIEDYNAKLDAALIHCREDDIETIKFFVALCFYTRDVKEKGERTLFDIAFIRLWLFDSNLAKTLVKFIVGTNGTEYFGCWKDLHQIMSLAKKLHLLPEDKYDELFRFFIEFEGEQLLIDWREYIRCKDTDSRPNLSLCAKWAISSGKSFDHELEHNGKSYVANFCEINAKRLNEMSQLAHDAHLDGYKRTVKTTAHIELQKVFRKVKSKLNEVLDTPEQKMCTKQWSSIDISSVPARNMTKHRRAFNNEKTDKERRKDHSDGEEHPYGDRYELPYNAPEVESLLDSLSHEISSPDFADKVAKFWRDRDVMEYCEDADFRKSLDRIICRMNVISTMVSGKKSIHGARSDINDLVTAAWKIQNGGNSYNPDDISSWASFQPDRALLHMQVQDKIKDISATIEKALLEAPTEGVRINLKRVIGLYDVSGSMESGSGSVRPIDVCVGLAYIISQLTCDGKRDPIGITFHERPNLFSIPRYLDFVSALHHIKRQNWGGSTDFAAAYRLILDRAIRFGWTQEDMPEALMVFSDMQFNMATARSLSPFETMYETLKADFNRAEYQLPLLVFWNLNGKYKGQSVGESCPGVITISGYDPAIFKAIAECSSLLTKDVATGEIKAASPLQVMISTLSRERYQPVMQAVIDYYGSETAESS